MRFHTILWVFRSDIITITTQKPTQTVWYYCIGILIDPPAMGIKKQPNCQPPKHRILYSTGIFFSTHVNRFSSGIQVSFPIAIRQHTTYPNSDHRKKRYMMLSSVTYSSVKYDERYCISHSPPASYMSKKWINENRFLRFPCWGFIPPLSTRNNTNQQNQTSNRVRQTKQQQTNNKQLE